MPRPPVVMMPGMRRIVLLTYDGVQSLEALRVERARGALEGTDRPVDAVARACGFGTVETLRRAFGRRVGVAPAAYRDRFRTHERSRHADRDPAVR